MQFLVCSSSEDASAHCLRGMQREACIVGERKILHAHLNPWSFSSMLLLNCFFFLSEHMTLHQALLQSSEAK